MVLGTSRTRYPFAGKIQLNGLFCLLFSFSCPVSDDHSINQFQLTRRSIVPMITILFCGHLMSCPSTIQSHDHCHQDYHWLLIRSILPWYYSGDSFIFSSIADMGGTNLLLRVHFAGTNGSMKIFIPFMMTFNTNESLSSKTGDEDWILIAISDENVFISTKWYNPQMSSSETMCYFWLFPHIGAALQYFGRWRWFQEHVIQVCYPLSLDIVFICWWYHFNNSRTLI